MERDPETELIEQVNKWCNHCRLYVAKDVIYKAQPDELETIATLTLETLLGRIDRTMWDVSIQRIFNGLPPSAFKGIKTTLNEMPIGSGLSTPFED